MNMESNVWKKAIDGIEEVENIKEKLPSEIVKEYIENGLEEFSKYILKDIIEDGYKDDGQPKTSYLCR